MRYFTIFGRTPNTHLQQNLKVIIVLGVTLDVLGSCGCFLWSYVGETLCLDINQTGCVDVDFPIDVLVFFEDPIKF